jgi:hypothetical protein
MKQTEISLIEWQQRFATEEACIEHLHQTGGQTDLLVHNVPKNAITSFKATTSMNALPAEKKPVSQRVPSFIPPKSHWLNGSPPSILSP